MGPAGDRVSDDAAPLIEPAQEPAREGAFQISGAVIVAQGARGENREASASVRVGSSYTEFDVIDDENQRTRLALLMPTAEAVKLARGILERSPDSITAGESIP